MVGPVTAPTPHVRLAWAEPGSRSIRECSPEYPPALLVSYVFHKRFLKLRSDYVYRDWVMDSGAFSAKNSGVEIDLQEYIDTCQELLETDPKLSEVFALDVIGDWRASVKNYETMWKAGVPAIPAYHIGEPEELLLDLASAYNKIAVGGMAKLRGHTKLQFAEQCFARVWPVKVHGFGVGQERDPHGRAGGRGSIRTE